MCITFDIRIEELSPKLLASVARLPAHLLRHGHGELAAHRSVMEILVQILLEQIYAYLSKYRYLPGAGEDVEPVLEELEGDEDGSAAEDVGARAHAAHPEDGDLPLEVQLTWTKYNNV